MRFVAIAIVLLSFPGFVYLLRTNPKWRHWAYFGLGLLPFTITAWNLDAGIINWGHWSGYAKGIVLTMEDTLALAIITTHRQPRGLPPMIGFLFLYMAAVALSVVWAQVPTAATFYVFQLMRFAVLLIAVAKIASNPRALQWLVLGLAAGMMIEGVVTTYQKFHGAFRTAGTMSHPNQLGMMAHFAVLPMLGMLLSGYRNPILMAGMASSLVAIVFGASRATIMYVGLGVAVLLILSLRRSATANKKKMVALTGAMMLVATPFLLNAIGKRMAQEIEHDTGYDERAAFERAANMIWTDHPMGIGANNYVLVANTQGYSARAGVVWNGGSRATNVHNTYLLVAAETGWLGLITYVLMLLAFVRGGWRFAFGNRKDPRGDIALGAMLAIVMMMLHSKYEWITITYEVQYLMAISLGMISGLVRVRDLERKQLRRERAAESALIEATAEQAIG